MPSPIGSANEIYKEYTKSTLKNFFFKFYKRDTYFEGRNYSLRREANKNWNEIGGELKGIQLPRKSQHQWKLEEVRIV